MTAKPNNGNKGCVPNSHHTPRRRFAERSRACQVIGLAYNFRVGCQTHLDHDTIHV
jgi:hypothetical protein